MSDQDRGDLLETPAAPEPELEKDTSPEAQAVEELVDNALAEPEAEAEEQPRAKDGKFAKKPVPDHVPKARFDEAVNKERAAREAAEARAKELESRLQQEAKSADVAKMEANIEALEAKHAKLLLDGEHEEAAAVMKQIRHGEREIAKMESEAKFSNATERAVEQVRMEATIARLESDFPALNQESESYDQDLVDIILAEQARLIQTQGYNPSKALQTAATKIMSKMQAPLKAEEKGGLGAAKMADRKADQVAKNLDTAKKQPSSMRESGKDSDKSGEGKIDVTSLSQAEFAALPETTKRKLRGDDV